MGTTPTVGNYYEDDDPVYDPDRLAMISRLTACTYLPPHFLKDFKVTLSEFQAACQSPTITETPPTLQIGSSTYPTSENTPTSEDTPVPENNITYSIDEIIDYDQSDDVIRNKSYTYPNIPQPEVTPSKYQPGAVNVKAIGDYSHIDGHAVDDDGIATLSWDVQFIEPQFGYSEERLGNSTLRIMVPKHVTNITAEQVGIPDKDKLISPNLDTLNVDSKYFVDAPTYESTKPSETKGMALLPYATKYIMKSDAEKGGVVTQAPLDAFHTDGLVTKGDSPQVGDYNAYGQIGPMRMGTTTDVFSVWDGAKELVEKDNRQAQPERDYYRGQTINDGPIPSPAGLEAAMDYDNTGKLPIDYDMDDTTSTNYTIIEIPTQRSAFGMHTIRITGDIDVSEATTDVVVPLRAVLMPENTTSVDYSTPQVILGRPVSRPR